MTNKDINNGLSKNIEFIGDGHLIKITYQLPNNCSLSLAKKIVTSLNSNDHSYTYSLNEEDRTISINKCVSLEKTYQRILDEKADELTSNINSIKNLLNQEEFIKKDDDNEG